MRKINFAELRRTNLELAHMKERLSITSKSLNRIKIYENPEQYQMLLRTARRRWHSMFRKTGERQWEYIGGSQ